MDFFRSGLILESLEAADANRKNGGLETGKPVGILHARLILEKGIEL